MGDLILRDPVPEDVPFVVQTYVRRASRALYPSERVGLPWPDIAERFVARCLDDGACRIAAWRDSPIILGYALGHRDSADRAILHWLHVKELYRRRGIARRLVSDLAEGRELHVSHTLTGWQRKLVKDRGLKVAARWPWLHLLTPPEAA